PPPLSVTRPPPSIVISGPVSFLILAGRSSVIVTGSGPQSNVMTPPAATAAITAGPVQLAAAPSPTTVRGAETSARPPSSGTLQVPAGFPAGGPLSGSVSGFGTSTPPSPPQPNAITAR